MTEYIDRNKQLVRLYRLNLDCKEVIKEFLMTAPTVEAEPVKHGEWIAGREIAREMLCDKTICVFYENYKCSECGLILDRLLFNVDGTPFYKYCPNCGAKMDATQSNDFNVLDALDGKEKEDE